jgi:hypothetical protein
MKKPWWWDEIGKGDDPIYFAGIAVLFLLLMALIFGH